jgi:hypothetical protein
LDLTALADMPTPTACRLLMTPAWARATSAKRGGIPLLTMSIMGTRTDIPGRSPDKS